MTRDLTDFIPRPGEGPMLSGIEFYFVQALSIVDIQFSKKGENDGF